MTIQEFLNKWGYQSAIGYGSAQFDCRDTLKKDVDELMKESIDLIKYFVNRVEEGSIRSKTTYTMYKDYLKTLE